MAQETRYHAMRFTLASEFAASPILRVAVVGQYSAGKSTIISALTSDRSICIDADIASIKLIVTDLDNTLLRRDKTISDYTVNMFARLRQSGVLVAFATARPIRATRRAVEADALIAHSGANVLIGDKEGNRHKHGMVDEVDHRVAQHGYQDSAGLVSLLAQEETYEEDRDYVHNACSHEPLFSTWMVAKHGLVTRSGASM